jgi:hypothetical protein
MGTIFGLIAGGMQIVHLNAGQFPGPEQGRERDHCLNVHARDVSAIGQCRVSRCLKEQEQAGNPITLNL